MKTKKEYHYFEKRDNFMFVNIICGDFDYFCSVNG